MRDPTRNCVTLVARCRTGGGCGCYLWYVFGERKAVLRGADYHKQNYLADRTTREETVLCVIPLENEAFYG